MSFTGTGFSASNTKSGADSVLLITIYYAIPSRSWIVATVTPDASGNINGTFRVPSMVTFTTNVLSAEFSYGVLGTPVAISATHTIPP